MRITIDMMMEKNPCASYSRERVEQLWAGRESLTLMEICDLDIPVADRIWAATCFFGDRENRLMACDFAETIAHLHPICSPTIAVSRRYADGLATEEELAAARAAALDAAWSAESAALDAARAAAWAAARAAARYAAWSAAESSAWGRDLEIMRKWCAEVDGKCD